MQSLRQICLGILGLFAGAILQAQDFSFKEVEVSHEAPITTFQHPWQGMRVALLGDSISDPMMTRYMGRKQYWSYLEDWLQLQVYDYAVSGMEWVDVPRQLGKLEEEHGADVDAILILMGTNDYNMGVPTGDWYTESQEYVLAGTDMRVPATHQLRRRRTLVMDDATMKGRINLAMKQIKEKYPRTPVVLLTLLHRGDFKFNEGNVQPEETYTNSVGEYLEAYVDAIKEAGNIWSVNVIDLNAVSNMDPLHGQDFYYGGGNDLLHPGPEGSRHLASVLYYQLLPIAVKDL